MYKNPRGHREDIDPNSLQKSDYISCCCQRCSDEKPNAEWGNIDDPGNDFIGEVTELFAEAKEEFAGTNSARSLLQTNDGSP
jgi:hypothetical protein